MLTNEYPSIIRKKKIKREERGKKKRIPGITKLNKMYSMAALTKCFTLCGETRLKQERTSGQMIRIQLE